MAYRYRAVASIEKAHGNKGKVVAIPRPGLPCLLIEGMRVALVPPDLDTDRFATVEEVEDGGTGQLVSFSGIRDRDAASRCVGKTVLLDERDLPEGFWSMDAASLIGKRILDEGRGLSGSIDSILIGVQNVWEIHLDDGREVLLPAVEDFLGDIDGDGIIRVRIPDGLIEGGR
ncbi:MAG: 16S rRNA processing protein RimM [Atopobiaceae bacterium]|nr:16S rRNA processing protein RimM [Atopobiaceae bacterium]